MSQKKVKKIFHSKERVDRYTEIEIEKARIKATLMRNLGVDPKDEAILGLVIRDLNRGF